MRALVVAGSMLAAAAGLETAPAAEPFAAYGALLSAVVRSTTVDYAAMQRDRSRLDAAVASFRGPDAAGEPSWPRDERFAFWINAYNVFTLAAIVNHYPIRGSWLSLAPRNSIRQIDGVWTELKWEAAGRTVTLDQIEHEILRPAFKDPRVHFAINCASRSCPPLAAEPYAADRLEAQLDAAARRYLSSPYGLQIRGERLEVSSLFKWYGDDFIVRYASRVDGTGSARDRAILGFVARFGPPAAADLVQSGRARIGFLRYDWSLNDRTP